MEWISIRTRPMRPPKDSLWNLLDEHIRKIQDGDIVLITSKILGIHQGRCVPISPDADKETLVRQEADEMINDRQPIHPPFQITIKHNTLIASAGIDESNALGHYVLWPKNVNLLLREIHQYICKKRKTKKLGVIATDSHIIPLRRGVVGVSIGFYGIEPLKDYRGKKDIFGRKLLYKQTNIVDSIASFGVLLMGEGSEQTPIVILRHAHFVRFVKRGTYRKLIIPRTHDLYYPLLKGFKKT
ncbi:coenzyme F420-0:L-glutamate ligase [Candidatus Uhrbacteria bacterium]|nr:coenzyme F420-0:L-glutamate ligase [Candidatus Uhrbacteria bacterium]